LCPESLISDLHRAALLRAASQSPAASYTTLTNLFTGRPARGIVNRVIRELGPLNAAVPAFPLATTAIGPLRAAAEMQGSSDFTPLWCGQNASGCRAIPAGELTRQLGADLNA
jgi:nitronate monooxygenase